MGRRPGFARGMILCGAALLGAALLSGCGKASAPAPTPTPFLPTATVAKPTATSAPAGSTATATTSSVAQISFKNTIEPIFQAHCAACHVSQQLGGLSLASYQGLMKGGSIVSGSIVKPGNHKASVLWNIISPSGPYPGGNRMPLGGPYLDSTTINTIAAWIDQGAKNN